MAATRVKIATTMGDVTLELEDEKAPATVANFLQYVDDGYYDGTVFHRIIPNFSAQSEGLTPDDITAKILESVPKDKKLD